MVRIVLAGIGGYGDNYIAELLENCPENVELTGICDPFAAASPRFSCINEKQIPVYASLDEYFNSPREKGRKTDLTVISSPIHTHYDFMKCALVHGSNVLCEKPPCTVLDQFSDLEEMERKTGLFIGVGFQQCYDPQVQELKKDIAAGVYGKPKLLKTLRLMRRGKKYYSRNSWAGRIGSGTRLVLDSPLNNACAHEFENMLFVLGSKPDTTAEIKNVTARLYRANSGIENYDAVALQAQAVCVCSGISVDVPLYYYAAHCIEEEKTGPFSRYEFEKAVIEYKGGFYASDMSGKMIKDYRTIPAGGKLQKLYDCITCIENGTQPVCRLYTCFAHMTAVHMAQAFPVQQVPEANLACFTKDDDSFCAVKDLSRIFTDCYTSARLPGDGEII